MFKQQIRIQLQQENFVMHQDKVVHWENENALLLGDLHAGKAMHFRKSGIPLSSDHLLRDLNKVAALVTHFKADKVWFLGDLFHSTHNEECQLIDDWLQHQPFKSTLVVGNHDVHAMHESTIDSKPTLEIRNILLTHEPTNSSTKTNICGHLHPGFSMSGPGRQHLNLPAFYVSEKHFVLPSFGRLTGKKAYKEYINKCTIYPITEEGIFEWTKPG